ncbi:hypothetical protein MTR_7g032910 [Medicago truncatula]|uniref:Uncharacterized protein n=1 Tax=Medicago truncatula TaxID=3880 RepID=G7L5H1_MEDTR|nr:hypothetical protein MTR_7g032910 [Medicago truncatula]
MLETTFSTPAPYNFVPLERLQIVFSKPQQAHNFLCKVTQDFTTFYSTNTSILLKLDESFSFQMIRKFE